MTCAHFANNRTADPTSRLRLAESNEVTTRTARHDILILFITASLIGFTGGCRQSIQSPTIGIEKLRGTRTSEPSYSVKTHEISLEASGRFLDFGFTRDEEAIAVIFSDSVEFYGVDTHKLERRELLESSIDEAVFVRDKDAIVALTSSMELLVVDINSMQSKTISYDTHFWSIFGDRVVWYISEAGGSSPLFWDLYAETTIPVLTESQSNTVDPMFGADGVERLVAIRSIDTRHGDPGTPTYRLVNASDGSVFFNGHYGGGKVPGFLRISGGAVTNWSISEDGHHVTLCESNPKDPFNPNKMKVEYGSHAKWSVDEQTGRCAIVSRTKRGVDEVHIEMVVVDIGRREKLFNARLDGETPINAAMSVQGNRVAVVDAREYKLFLQIVEFLPD